MLAIEVDSSQIQKKQSKQFILFATIGHIIFDRQGREENLAKHGRRRRLIECVFNQNSQFLKVR